MKYRSQWPTFIVRSNVVSYWLIIPKYDVHTSNSLQDIRRNHWTVKYRSCWPSLYDPQVHVTRLSHVWPTICISCFHNRKGYLWSKYECFLMSGWWDIPHLRNFNVKLWSNSTNGTESRTNKQTNEHSIYHMTLKAHFISDFCTKKSKFWP